MVFFNNSKAANVDLSLTITAGGVPSCSNSATVTLTSLSASFAAQSQT
jgi:acid phosphatase family membrane protein YuiD